MEHSPDKHIEHAEHNEHLGQDPFNRRVAMTITIIAAMLAGVTLLSHRGHTETLSLQAKANICHTKKTDQWNFYQAKNVRSYLLQAFLAQSDLIPATADTDRARKKARVGWAKKVAQYEGIRGEDEKRNAGEGDLAKLQAAAEALEQQAEELETESHHVHAAVNWIDYGHLAIELALIFCSVAVLTKQRAFWFSGMGIALVGAVLSGAGVYRWMFLDPYHH